jgi:mRNA-degrading endonuclease YafQ of YafQ-DinJ toxin-antitoxin module
MAPHAHQVTGRAAGWNGLADIHVTNRCVLYYRRLRDVSVRTVRSGGCFA